MIGLKSVSAVVVAAILLAIAGARGALSAAYLASLSGAAWFAIGVVASLACGLVGVGWRFGVKSRAAVALSGRRLVLVDETEEAHELPAGAQRALVLAAMVAIALPALGNHAMARVVAVPEDIAAPTASAYCLEKSASEAVESKRPAPAPSRAAPQAGCALVRRAVQLGYAKSLGTCASKQDTEPAVAAAKKREICTRRHLDEPYTHYAYRRLAEFFNKLGDTSPGEAITRDETAVRAHFDHADDLLADIRHAITGSPHASHHIWVSLPDPHPTTLEQRLTGIPRCSTRFADLPLWPAFANRSELVEHVLGQLLFASRFGTTASCNDYAIHWDAPVDACAKLTADPIAFLGRDGALASLRAVLDRRRRQLAIIDLDRTLDRRLPEPPPPVSAVVSLQCLGVDPTSAPPSGGAARSSGAGPFDHAGKPTASAVNIDGESVAVRELHVATIRTDSDGPIDVYLALAALLAGTDVPPPRAPEALDTSRFPLVALDTLVDTDPFAGARWPLADPALAAVFPFELHLHAFVDAFRRRYLPQRGRL